MIIIHSVQKLLNTSRLKASLYISQPDKDQLLHSWYAKLLATGYSGKLLVQYVHEPSLMAVICKGKTISGTWDPFKNRLEGLLRRFEFPHAFIEREMKLTDGYVVSKTNSKSILSHMNQMVFQLEYDCSRFRDYDSISLNYLEDRMMENLYQFGKGMHDYRTPLDYWKKALGLPS